MFTITTFYKFIPVANTELPNIRKHLLVEARSRDLRGAIIMSTEGCNGTIGGTATSIRSFKKLLIETFGDLHFKDSKSRTLPFARFKIKIKEEIVTLHRPDLVPQHETNYVTPSEWNELSDSEDVVILDVRNAYETKIGAFEAAVDPKLRHFKHFPEYVKQLSLPRDKKILMYCTGGIRCEKASLAMREQGYTNVYQLHGGILEYLAQYPDGKFQGECFVFDERVAVNKHLLPSSEYQACPHCGDPGKEQVTCSSCGKTAIACESCQIKKSCSKLCARKIHAVCSD